MRYLRVVPALLMALLCLPGCSSFRRPLTGEGALQQQKFSTTAYINAGDALHLIVDVRAARITGPAEFLPLQVALLNRTKEPLQVTRESFVLETDGGAVLPLATFREVDDAYRRQRIDRRIGVELADSLRGRYPSPPFRHRRLEFFPPRDTAVPPRQRIRLRQGELAMGYLYFHLPSTDALGTAGACALLVTPAGSTDRFVVDLQAYRKPDRREKRRRAGGGKPGGRPAAGPRRAIKRPAERPSATAIGPRNAWGRGAA